MHISGQAGSIQIQDYLDLMGGLQTFGEISQGPEKAFPRIEFGPSSKTQGFSIQGEEEIHFTLLPIAQVMLVQGAGGPSPG